MHRRSYLNRKGTSRSESNSDRHVCMILCLIVRVNSPIVLLPSILWPCPAEPDSPDQDEEPLPDPENLEVEASDITDLERPLTPPSMSAPIALTRHNAILFASEPCRFCSARHRLHLRSQATAYLTPLRSSPSGAPECALCRSPPYILSMIACNVAQRFELSHRPAAFHQMERSGFMTTEYKEAPTSSPDSNEVPVGNLHGLAKYSRWICCRAFLSS